MNITEYADVINKGVIINYYHNQNTRWSAAFEHSETKDDAGSEMLKSEYGSGHTPEEALVDYLDKIRGKILIFNATSPDKRVEYVVPDHITAKPDKPK